MGTDLPLWLPALALPTPPRSAYIVVFGAAAVLCLATLRRASRVTDRDTRRGLQFLLVTSAGWATSHVGFFMGPTRSVQVAFYVLGLIFGLAAVLAWLYFCSAYTGRSLHRKPAIRRTSLAIFLGIVAVKVTNPAHHLYFTVGFAQTPFPHITIQSGTIHWVVMGLSYAVAAIGYFMVFERFQKVGYESRSLAALILITGLPVMLDIIGFSSPVLIDITYEPIGVAVFASGVLYLYLERFQKIQLAGEQDSPVIFLDHDDNIRDFNRSATEQFPRLSGEGVIGSSLEAVVPELLDALEGHDPVIELPGDGKTRYMQVSTNPFEAGGSETGRALILTDVTEREEYRKKLERQNERLDAFASMVSHDLRNPLNVATGRLELALEEGFSGSGEEQSTREHLKRARDALERMDALIEDVLTLAREGREIDEVASLSLAEVMERSWKWIDTRDASLEIEGDTTLEADPERLQQALENLVRNAIEHGGQDVEIVVGPLDDVRGFFLSDDGPGVPAEARESVFDSGFTTSAEGTGFGLAIVEEIVEAHGWDVSVTESSEGGARFEIRTSGD
ncbi:MAG: ATP-binding protein [Halodesulfurarchaeum sp.]